MKVVHYTKPFFKLRPINIENAKDRIPIKPQGGLWCSPLDSTWGWVDWCKAEDFDDIEHKQRVILDVDISQFFVIDNVNDMGRLPWFSIYKTIYGIDFERMVKEGMAGIYLTKKGQFETRFTFPKSLYGWDCETVLIMSNECIRSIEV